MRFFNNKLNEFDFYPQVAHPYRIDDGDLDNKYNLDWNARTSGSNAKKDHLDKFCSLKFDPKLANTNEPYYIATDLSESAIDEKVTEGVKSSDVYGISVNSQVINIEDKVASLTFMRPIKPIHPQDLEIVQGQTYNIFVSYGIFPDAENDETKYVRGNMQTGDI